MAAGAACAVRGESKRCSRETYPESYITKSCITQSHISPSHISPNPHHLREQERYVAAGVVRRALCAVGGATLESRPEFHSHTLSH